MFKKLFPLVFISMLIWSIPHQGQARPAQMRISFIDAVDVDVDTMQWREQTTRRWLPGCQWYDVLQGSGWFPATFYYDFAAVEEDEATYLFTFEQRKPLATYCGAKTDNVANYISFTIATTDHDQRIYGGIPFEVSDSHPDQTVEVICQLVEDNYGPQVNCERALLADDDELEIVVYWLP